MVERSEINMADVARRAGVSVATVSRAMRGLPGVGEATRARILAIADELAYVISPEASRLSSGQTGRVGVVVPATEKWFYGEMLAAIERRLRAADLDVLLYQVSDTEVRRRFFQDLPTRRKVDGVVLIALPLPQEEVDRLDLLGVEVVVAGGRIRDFAHVEVDDRAIAMTAVEHLVGLGHRRIAMIRATIYGDEHWAPDTLRLEGFHQGLEAAGLPLRDDYVISVPFAPTAGAAGTQRLLALDEPPTAILCFSDEIAFGALQGARAAGLSVPGDVSIVGIDDHPLAEVMGLTTVRQDVAGQGERAADMILRRLSHTAVEDHVEPHELVIRTSTGPPRTP
ncbi:LacI family DNA-binding transcriptional regulator [Nocardioides jiangxiensis]|uniref:LacI family DNA-binding transcriptional regulator n=1 Tax=Nocardioides jiangxiensis TaxID=3064524 RepID=A0ABT9B0J0_9ACTN|nr:LacI family DNA-binding transcriptional regulator [Nocardioides sp. WY-20]MDO7868371.1 LacI family DNA-binding transcriptional regulator [Nocardioides sp. WY-20]